MCPTDLLLCHIGCSFAHMTGDTMACMRPNACAFFLFQMAFAVLYIARSMADAYTPGTTGLVSKS